MRSFLLVTLVSVFGCSSSTPESTSTAIPAALEGYCTGTLRVATKVESPAAGGGWEGSGATLPAGTPFVVAVDFSRFGGFAFSNGAPQKLDGDFIKGLVLGTDFESSCATKPDRDKADFVLLAKATLFTSKDLTGSPCAIPAGTKFKSYGYSGGEGPATFESSELTALCGFAKGYSNDFHYGALVRK